MHMHPRIFSRDQHPISRKQMPEEVLKVLYRLRNTGHIAYLCGGGVRDLLLGRTADDFDVATDAHPKRLKEVFRNCRLVGRRFRIAHIFFKGQKIIEVSTFRKQADGEMESAKGGQSFLIRKDNTFGTPADDAFRRDFTINGLYYNIRDFSLIDYVGGLEDLEARLIRAIGDPDVRFQEDPVRILRGIRLAAFLGFRIEKFTWEAMIRQKNHIWECAPARITEEVMKILRRGQAQQAFRMMSACGILELLFPALVEFLQAASQTDRTAFWLHLKALDGLLQNRTEFSDPLLLSTLLVSPVTVFMKNLSPGCDIGQALRHFIGTYFEKLTLSRFTRSQTLLLLLALRHMLTPRRRRRRNLRKSPIFKEALNLLEIHCLATDQHWPVFKHWKNPSKSQQRQRHSRKKSWISIAAGGRNS